jgi:hypothetical protein
MNVIKRAHRQSRHALSIGIASDALEATGENLSGQSDPSVRRNDEYTKAALDSPE